MRHFSCLKKFHFFIVTVLVAFFSCGEQDLIQDNNDNVNEVVSVNTIKLRSGSSDVDVNQVVNTYIDNFEDVLYGVESFITNKNGLTNSVTENNPIDSMFAHFDIVDAETNIKLSVLDMNPDELNTFINLYLNKEKAELQQMLTNYPELAQNIREGNNIHEQVKIELGRGGTRLATNIVSYQNYNAALNNVVAEQQQSVTISGGLTPLGNKPPATMYWTCPYCGMIFHVTEASSHHCIHEPDDPDPVPDPPKTPQELLANGIRHSGANKGDIIITLAGDNGDNFVPPVLLEATLSNANPSYRVGHVGVFNFTPQTYHSNTTLLNGETIEAWYGNYWSTKENKYIEHQVMYRQIMDWDNATAVYILGVQHWKLKWKWRGLQSGLYYEYTPVTDPSLLATEAATHIGKPYSSWASFGWSKARAPHSFQCASLTWYCAKKAYGCRLAPVLSLTVTPANIFFDRNTYIKKRIIVKPKNP